MAQETIKEEQMNVQENEVRDEHFGSLVISRKLGEPIIIGEGEDRIEVKIYERRGDKFRVRITAPKRARISRG